MDQQKNRQAIQASKQFIEGKTRMEKSKIHEKMLYLTSNGGKSKEK